MNLRALLLGASAVGLALPALSQSASAPVHEQRDGVWYRLENGRAYRVHTGEVTVKWAAPVADLAGFRAALGSDAAAFEGLTTVRSNRLGIHDLGLPAGSDPLETVARLNATGLVEFAQEVTYGHYEGGPPNDPMFGQLWHLQNTGQTGGTPGADINALPGWSIQDGDPAAVVAVVDSGTDWFHPDLAAAMWSNPGEIPNNDQDDDNNGFIDDTVGWNFQYNTKDPSSGFYHGTAVASVVGAVGNNGIGLVGVGGGGQDGVGLGVMALQVGEFGPISSLLDDAIIYAMDNGADVVTMSLSVPSDQPITAAVDAAYAAGVFINCSAGNFGGVGFPAQLTKIVAVGGTNHNDSGGGFSTGPEILVSAPSSNITMCDLGGGYTTSSGTSFGSPMVAALAGMALSINPNLTPAQVADVIKDGADDVAAPGFDTQTGWGRINLATTLGLVDTTVAIFGTGTLTAQGKVPLVGWGGGSAVVGNNQFQLELDDVRFGSTAILAVGLGSTPVPTPFVGGNFYVDLSKPILWDVRVADVNGHAEVAFPIPGDPGLQGANFTAQWVVADPVVQFALSAALVATIDV